MKFLKYTKLALFSALLGLAACSNNDDPVAEEKITLTVQAVAPTTDDAVSDYSQFDVVALSERDGSRSTAKLSQSGQATLTLDKGSYTITINGNVDGKAYYGTTGVKQYSQSQELNLNVEHIVEAYAGSKKGFVISELFYNGGTYAGKMQHPDQYIVIANNSDETLYADGLVIAQSSNMNSLPCSTLTALLPDFVAVANMYQIPGSGTDYPVKAGEVIVIAASALNHAETIANYSKTDKDTGIPGDLSGADFELADEDASMSGKVTDNPEVPNLKKISNSMPNGVTGWMHPYGIRPMFIFDGSGIDWTDFKTKNAITYTEKPRVDKEIAEYQAYKIPTSLIVDGIETKSSTTPYWGNYTSKTLPAEVDKGVIEATLGPSCHINSYLYRVKGSDGKYVDTNDSSTDCKVEHRADFAGYPKGWRQK